MVHQNGTHWGVIIALMGTNWWGNTGDNHIAKNIWLIGEKEEKNK